MSQDEDVIDIGAIFRVLWRGKFILFLTMVVGGVLGFVYADKVPTPMYRSTTVVMLNNREEQVVDLGNVVGGLGSDMSDINTEVQVLRSRNLMGKVVDELELTKDPEFNFRLRKPSNFDQIKTSVGDFVGGLLSGFDEKPEVEVEVEPEAVRQSVINVLLGRIEVRNLPQTLVFNIAVTSESSRKAALIADTLANAYIQDQLAVKFEATEQATAWLTGRVSDLQVALEEAEQAVKNFQAETTLVSPEALNALGVQAKDLRDRIQTSEISLTKGQARLAALNAAETPAQKAAISEDLQLQRLLPRVSDPKIRSSFDRRLEQVLLSVQQDIARNANQIDALRASLASLNEQIDQQSEDLIVLQQLTREAEANRLLYEYFLTRLKETSAQQGIHQADSRVISSAVVPGGPASPRKTVILIMGSILGLIGGLIILATREMGRRAFQTASQLEVMTGYTVASQIPVISTGRRKNTLIYLKEKPASSAAEAIRNLRTTVMLSNVDKPPQVIMICSSLPGEGKTTTSMALAQNFAAMGRKTLLIEGDIRRRIFSEYLNQSELKDGLVAVITGERYVEDVIIKDELIGADVLRGDKSNANAADIFSSARFTSLISELRSMYDTIIIDTPPVLIVPDARVIAQVVDSTMFVVKWDQTQREEVLAALREFESVGKPVSGLILNQIDVRKSKRYGYGYVYGGYGSKYYLD